MHTKFIVFFSRSTILQILKWNWRTAQKIIWLTPYFNKGVIQGREDPPSATKNLETSDCGDGWKVRTDSKQQPFSFTSPPGVQGTGGIHAGGTHCADVGPRGLHKQRVAFIKRKREGATIESSSTNANAASKRTWREKWKWPYLSIQKNECPFTPYCY